MQMRRPSRPADTHLAEGRRSSAALLASSGRRPRRMRRAAKRSFKVRNTNDRLRVACAVAMAPVNTRRCSRDRIVRCMYSRRHTKVRFLVFFFLFFLLCRLMQRFPVALQSACELLLSASLTTILPKSPCFIVKALVRHDRDCTRSLTLAADSLPDCVKGARDCAEPRRLRVYIRGRAAVRAAYEPHVYQRCGQRRRVV